MDYKKYSKDNSFSYTFGAYPTYELINKKSNEVKEIILHEKLEIS